MAGCSIRESCFSGLEDCANCLLLSSMLRVASATSASKLLLGAMCRFSRATLWYREFGKGSGQTLLIDEQNRSLILNLTLLHTQSDRSWQALGNI